MDRIQQRMWSRSLIFQLVAVFKVFSQARVLPHQVDCMTALMMEFMGLFALLPAGKKVRRYSASRVRECPAVPAHPSWALIKWLWPESLMRVGRTGLVTPCLLHMRLYGGCGGGRGEGERAEAGAVVQLCRSPWVSQLWTSLCSSATSSCSPRSVTRMRLRFSSSSECGTFLLCSADVHAQCNLCRRPAIPRYWCSSGGLSFSRRRLGEEGGSSCFQAWDRGSSHR